MKRVRKGRIGGGAGGSHASAGGGAAGLVIPSGPHAGAPGRELARNQAANTHNITRVVVDSSFCFIRPGKDTGHYIYILAGKIYRHPAVTAHAVMRRRFSEPWFICAQYSLPCIFAR
jgi:hypothetical protein